MNKVELKAEGRVYKTKQRQALQDYLQEVKRPCSAAELYQALQDRGMKMGLTTVYRNLCFLADQGYIKQVWTEKGMSAARFQVIEEGSHTHVHLHCGQCGNDEQLDCGAFSELQHHFASAHRFNLDLKNLVLDGLCENCQTKED